MVHVGGLDLAALPTKCSGYSLLNVDARTISNVRCLHSDEEIVNTVLGDGVSVLAVDAPIAEKPVFREVDRVAIKQGYRVLPPSFKGMRMLTERAWRLYRLLMERGVKVIETHPRSVLRKCNVEDVLELLNVFGIKCGSEMCTAVSKDVADGIVCSVVAYCYYVGYCLDRIEAADGCIYLVKC